MTRPAHGFGPVRRQQAGLALVQLEQEGDALGVGLVACLAAAGLVGHVHGGVEFLVGAL